MKLNILALALALGLAVVPAAHAQRGGGGGNVSNWELLGESKVGLGADRDVIQLGRNEDYFRGRGYRKLRFIVEGGDVRMRSITLVYLNGHREEMSFEQNMRPGQNIDIDLRGERSYLRQIEMFYKGKLGLNLGGGGLRIAQPTVQVFGENVRVAPRPEPPIAVSPPKGGGRGFDEIARERFDRRDSEVEIKVGRREGRFGQIRLSNTSGDRIDLKEVVAVFANGDRQRVRLEERLEPGEQTRPIDLEGDRRHLGSVIVVLDPRRRPGASEITLLGTERGGRDDGGRPGPGAGPGFRPDPDWVPLGQQSVGFRADRDVIRVGKPEDFFHNRGFERLHFAAAGNDIHLMSLRIVYLNGQSEDYQVDRLIRAGSELPVDLRARRSYLREIEMVYRARPGFRGQAVISVYGEPSARRR